MGKLVGNLCQYLRVRRSPKSCARAEADGEPAPLRLGQAVAPDRLASQVGSLRASGAMPTATSLKRHGEDRLSMFKCASLMQLS